MAYHSASGTANNTADLLVRLKDFLVTTCGWTLHDDGSALSDPYYVLKSVGESGMEDIYIQFINDSSSDCISVKGYLYWNAATHTGVKVVFSSGATVISTRDSAQFLYWLYGDLDHVCVVTKITATYYLQYSGIIKRYWSGAVAITQAAVNAGSNVGIQVSDASLFNTGSYYIIKDDANIERVQVISRDTGSTPNTVTVATLAAAYASGAKVGEDPQPVIIGRNNMPGNFYALNKWNGYSSATGQAGNCGTNRATFAGYADTDVRCGLTIMLPWLVAITGTGNEELRGELIEIYSIGSGAGDTEDVLDLGTATYKMFNLSGGGWCAIKE